MGIVATFGVPYKKPTRPLWIAERFDVVIGPRVIRPVHGKTCAGLGLYLGIKGRGPNRRASQWCLIHLNTGHLICLITGSADEAITAANRFIPLTDWAFTSLTGWINQTPDLSEAIDRIVDGFPGVVARRAVYHCDADAQMILLGRCNA